MCSPATSSTSSHARGPRPLSITWVSPWCGVRPRSKSLIELLELRLRALLHVVEERVAVRVDPDGERAEVFHSELPEALGHQLFPRDLFDLLDLRRLERGSAADDREIDHAQSLHRLDRLVRQTALAADRAHAVLRAETFREAHHARRGGRPDADLLVLTGAELAHAGRGVQQECAAQVHWRFDALVEDPDLRAVADADDVSVDRHLVAGAQVADLFLGRGERQSLRTHGRTQPLHWPRRARLRDARPSTGS